MKFRKDFVTNSSSSSYVCEICGEEVSGFDISLQDYEMCECVNGHIVCWEHLIMPPKEKMIRYIIDEGVTLYNYDTHRYDIEFNEEELKQKSDDEIFEIIMKSHHCYELPEFMCPICQFDEYSEYDMASYLLTKYGVSKDEVFAVIKKQNKRRKKLYAHEYIAYVVAKFNLNLGEIQASWKNDYKSYAEFKESLQRF